MSVDETKSIPLLALGAMLLGACAIALAPIFVRLSDVGPTATAFWRCTLAVPMVWLLLFYQHKGLPRFKLKAEHRRALIIAGAFFSADLSFWHVSILWTSVANATLLANLAPFFVAAYIFLFRRQSLGRPTWAALACAALGIALLTSQNVELGGTRLKGDILGIITAACYAGYMLSVANARVFAGAMHVNLYTSGAAALFLAIIMTVLGESILPASFDGWWVLIGLALISQVLGQGLIVYAFAHLPITFGALSLLLQPVLAAIIAWFLFGEGIAPIEIIGGAIVLIAIFIARLDKKT
ncbi:MAG: DMT family transporter [Sphingomonadales bacterium]|jgi:drug/metabolite transporter (DMT)-like permease